ncbi:MAG: winged helix-turn-helix transcriptional regulator [Actinobacteria bacterium]|nr:winged helix-turn-helix transcriptional regulator [Actinomycetota bacterium]
MTGQSEQLTDDDFGRLLEFRDGLRRFLHWSRGKARDVGLTPAQHQLLLAVRGHAGPPSVGEVADHLLLRHHSVVELVDRTVQLGLVERVDDQRDHRVVRIRLTASGEAKLADLTAAHLVELSRLREQLGPLWAHRPAVTD